MAKRATAPRYRLRRKKATEGSSKSEDVGRGGAEGEGRDAEVASFVLHLPFEEDLMYLLGDPESTK